MQGQQSELALRRFEQEVLDVHHETFPCWKRDRADTTFCILAQFDIGNIMSIMMVPAFGSNPIGAPQAVKGTEDGLSQALRWLTDNGTKISVHPCNNPDAIKESLQYATFAATYTNIADFRKMYGRKLVEVTIDETVRVVRFSPKADSEIKNTFLGSVENIGSQLHKVKQTVQTFSEKGRQDLNRAIKKAAPTLDDGYVRINNAEPEALKPFFDFAQNLDITDYDFVDVSADLVGFTAGEFRSYFTAFRAWAMCVLGVYYNHIQRNPDVALTPKLIPTQFHEYDQFNAILAQLSDIDIHKVVAISDRLHFNNATSWPDIHLQPLLRCGKFVAWSPSIIQSSSYMRNTLRLMARTPSLKTIADDVIGNREHAMLRSLGGSLSRRGKCDFKLNTRIESNGKSAEVDLVAYNKRNPTELLIVEGKTVLAVDEINEVDKATSEMQSGQAQLQNVIAMLKAMPELQKSRLFKFVAWDKVIDYYPLVVTPNSEPHQEFDHSAIPAISMSTIDVKMRDNHFSSPHKFWQRSRDRPWMQGMQTYERTHTKVKVGNVTYEIPIVVAPEAEEDNKWNPFASFTESL